MAATNTTSTEYMIRVQYRKAGQPGNERHINCANLNQLWAQIEKLKRDQSVYKVEAYSLLERTIITL